MTISSFAANKFVCELTFSAAVAAASVAVSTSQRIIGLQDGDSTGVIDNPGTPTQFLSFMGNHTISGGSATIVLFYADVDIPSGAGKMGIIDTLTLTASTTMRTSHDNASGNYVCGIVAALSLKNVVDIFPGIGARGFPAIFACCTALSGGSVTLQVAPGRAG